MADNVLIDLLMKILFHAMDEILRVLKIDSYDKPKIILHIDERTRLRCDGYYNHSSNTVSLNADLVTKAFNAIAGAVWDKKEKGEKATHEILKTPNVYKLIVVLAHELKHREQHLNEIALFSEELKTEEVLDLTKEEDLRKYLSMNIELDARAFSRIGAGVILGEWEDFYDPHNFVDAEDQKYAAFLLGNMFKYRDYIPDDVIQQLKEANAQNDCETLTALESDAAFDGDKYQ